MSIVIRGYPFVIYGKCQIAKNGRFQNYANGRQNQRNNHEKVNRL